MENDSQLTDWTEGIRSADTGAFESLYRALHDPLKGYARGFVSDEETAEDVVQECFIKLWQARDTLDGSKSVRALLYTMVRNHAFNIVRSQRTQDRHHLEFAKDQQDVVTDHTELDATKLGRLLDSWIAQLPERQREALRLSRLDGLSHAEVSSIMDVSQRTVNNHIVRALKYLRNEIRNYDESLITHYSL